MLGPSSSHLMWHPCGQAVAEPAPPTIVAAALQASAGQQAQTEALTAKPAPETEKKADEAPKKEEAENPKQPTPATAAKSPAEMKGPPPEAPPPQAPQKEATPKEATQKEATPKAVPKGLPKASKPVTLQNPLFCWMLLVSSAGLQAVVPEVSVPTATAQAGFS